MGRMRMTLAAPIAIACMAGAPVAAQPVAVQPVAAQPVAARPVRGTAVIDGADVIVELRTDGEIAVLRHRPATRPGDWTKLLLRGPSDVLPLLADTRLSFLWGAIDGWAGPDLGRLRDSSIALTRSAWLARSASAPPADASEGSVDPRVRALLQYAAALCEAGRFAEATALLEVERNSTLPKGYGKSMNWSVASLRLASVRLAAGDVPGALLLMRDTMTRLEGNPFQLNAEVTLAAMLAETGSFAEAGDLIDRARARFLAGQKHVRVVPGSLLQFDLVRACASHNQGKTDEAASLMAGLATAEQAEDRRLVPPRNRDNEERALICFRDPEGLVTLWRRDLRSPAIGSRTLLTAQPAYASREPNRPTVDRAHAIFTVGEPMRVLPARYTPALNFWRR